LRRAGTLRSAALPRWLTAFQVGKETRENNLAQAIREGASNSISQTGQQIVSRQLNIQPTLTIGPGFPVRVIVTRDLVLAAYALGGTR
jgi:type IV secretion system protein TrbI